MVVPESVGDDHRVVVGAWPLAAEYVPDAPAALDPADGVLNQDADAALAPVLLFERLAQRPALRFFPGQGNGVAGERLREARESRIDADAHALRDVVGEAGGLEQREVVLLPFPRGADVANPLLLVRDHEVFAGVALLLAGVAGRLPGRILGPLDRAFGAVEEDLLGFREGREVLLDRPDLPFRQHELLPQGCHQDRGERHHRHARTRPVPVVKETRHVERRVAPVVEQAEEEFVLGGRREQLAAAAGLAGSAPIGAVGIPRLTC